MQFHYHHEIKINPEYLVNRTVKNIYYVGQENVIEHDEFTLLAEGQVVFELDNGKLVEFFVEDGISTDWSEYRAKTLATNNVNANPMWSNITNKKITGVQLHQGFVNIEKAGQMAKKTVVLTLELHFYLGERIYISNAGFLVEGQLTTLTHDIILYTKWKTGIKYGLLNDNG